MKRGTIIIVVCLLVMTTPATMTVYGQDPVFSQFYAAPVYMNPAFAGSTKCSRIALSYQQFRGPENFHTLSFSYDRFSEALQGGFGLLVTSDVSNTTMMRNAIGALYAYHLKLSQQYDVHFGVQAGYIRNDSRWDRFEFSVPEDPPPNNWNHTIDLAAGVLLFSDVLYGGFAMHHMNEPNMSLYDADESKLPLKYTAHLGAYLQAGHTRGAGREGFDYYVSPNLIYQHQGYHSHINLGVYTGVKPLMTGIWYRHWLRSPGKANHTLVFLVGMNMGQYRIGYSYDYSLSGFSDVMHARHELSLAFRFNCPQRNIYGRIINCPSF